MLLGLFASGSYMIESRWKVREYGGGREGTALCVEIGFYGAMQRNKAFLNEKVSILVLPDYEPPYGPFSPPDPPALCKLLPLP